MIHNVLALHDIESYCPLCGRDFGRSAKTEEHIFPRWLQKHCGLETVRLNLPNFIGKAYKSVKIDICYTCNNKRFGQLETKLSQLIRTDKAYSLVQELDLDLLAVWLGKILWLLCRKGHTYDDHRTRNEAISDKIVPHNLMPGATYLGMMLRSFAMRKGMFSCYVSDPPIPEFFYEPPYSLYIVEIDTRDDRFETFDYFDNLNVLGAAIRIGSLGVICVFDGGLNGRFRSYRYNHLTSEKLHPVQFSELTARIFYDNTVLHEDALKVQYFWNRSLNAVVAQTQTRRSFNPFLEEHQDPRRLASMIARLTCMDPDRILQGSENIFTTLEDGEGKFVPFVVTDKEIQEASSHPEHIVLGPMASRWRTE